MIGPLDQLTSKRLGPLDVVRGVAYDAFPMLPAGGDPTVLEDGTFRDLGFLSASDLPELRGGFADKPIEMRIHLPAGTRGARLDEYGSDFAAEREVLLARGTGYVVRRVYRAKGRWVLDCEVMPE